MLFIDCEKCDTFLDFHMVSISVYLDTGSTNKFYHVSFLYIKSKTFDIGMFRCYSKIV